MGNRRTSYIKTDKRTTDMSGTGMSGAELCISPLARLADVSLSDAMVMATGGDTMLRPEKKQAFSDAVEGSDHGNINNLRRALRTMDL